MRLPKIKSLLEDLPLEYRNIYRPIIVVGLSLSGIFNLTILLGPVIALMFFPSYIALALLCMYLWVVLTTLTVFLIPKLLKRKDDKDNKESSNGQPGE